MDATRFRRYLDWTTRLRGRTAAFRGCGGRDAEPERAR
jgi:hypothetical protein